MTNSVGYSLIFPIKDEEQSVPILYEQLLRFLKELDGPAEVIFVDDGSTDQSLQLLRGYQEQDQRLKIIELSRNFGHQVAMTAGLDFAKGQAVIVLDADMQHPLSAVHDMIREWKNGYEIIYGVRQVRTSKNFFKTATARVFYRLFNKLTSTRIPVDVGDFRLIDRKALDAFLAMRERNRFVRGMFAWVGFKAKGIPYVEGGRMAGSTKYPLGKMVRLAFDAIISFSDLPLQIAIFLGLFTALSSVTLGIIYLIQKLTGGYTVRGWASLAVLISFLGGVIIMLLGILGLYVGRIYEETKARPLYVIRNIYESDQEISQN
jgi:polyisoprenyl-phosphate glycosyltransferase